MIFRVRVIRRKGIFASPSMFRDGSRLKAIADSGNKMLEASADAKLDRLKQERDLLNKKLTVLMEKL